MLLYSYNFSVTFQRKYSSYCMKSLKTNPTKWYSDMSSDVLFLFFFFFKGKKRKKKALGQMICLGKINQLTDKKRAETKI